MDKYHLMSKEELVEILRLQEELIKSLEEHNEALKDNISWYKMQWVDKVMKK